MFLTYLISLLYNFYFILLRRYLLILKTDSENVPTQFHDLNVDFALKLSNYTSSKRFIYLK